MFGLFALSGRVTAFVGPARARLGHATSPAASAPAWRRSCCSWPSGSCCSSGARDRDAERWPDTLIISTALAAPGRQRLRPWRQRRENAAVTADQRRDEEAMSSRYLDDDHYIRIGADAECLDSTVSDVSKDTIPDCDQRRRDRRRWRDPASGCAVQAPAA